MPRVCFVSPQSSTTVLVWSRCWLHPTHTHICLSSPPPLFVFSLVRHRCSRFILLAQGPAPPARRRSPSLSRLLLGHSKHPSSRVPSLHYNMVLPLPPPPRDMQKEPTHHKLRALALLSSAQSSFPSQHTYTSHTPPVCGALVQFKRRPTRHSTMEKGYTFVVSPLSSSTPLPSPSYFILAQSI